MAVARELRGVGLGVTSFGARLRACGSWGVLDERLEQLPERRALDARADAPEAALSLEVR